MQVGFFSLWNLKSESLSILYRTLQFCQNYFSIRLTTALLHRHLILHHHYHNHIGLFGPLYLFFLNLGRTFAELALYTEWLSTVVHGT